MKHCFTDAGRFQYEPKEKRDCTVRAMAVASDSSYKQAHALMKSYGRRNGHGVYMDEIMEQIRVVNGFVVTPMGDTGISLKKYVDLHC